MKQEPLVSILMNCYNGEEYLFEAVESVLAQTYENWEIIFWDNQSTDKSAEIFKSYDDLRLKYHLAPEHTDLGGGRAAAFQYLVGDFIAVLDVDDVWLPKKLEKQIPLFDEPDVGIVISDTVFFNENREKALYGVDHPPTGWVFEALLESYFVSLETVMFRRLTVMQLPRAFDPDFSFIADFDLVVRLSLISKLAFYPGILAKWRVHKNSDTWKHSYKFIEEKERWIAKQILEDKSFLKNYGKSIRVFSSSIYRGKALNELMNKGSWIGACKNVFKTRLVNWRDWVLLFLCFLPFSGKLLALHRRRKEQLI